MVVKKAAPPKRKRKTLRLPNGFGSISYLGEKRRKPYVARVYDHTEINDEKMTTTAVYKSLGTFETWDEAFLALAKYNEDPYDIDASHITFAQMYERWLAEYKVTPVNGKCPAEKTVKCHMLAYTHVKQVHDMELKAIKPLLIQQIVADCGLGAASQQQIINLFNAVFKYAMRLDIVGRNPTQGVHVTKAQEQTGTVYTLDEIHALWEMEPSLGRDALLVLLYTGMRIGELVTIKPENIFDDYVIGGIKTEASINRIIPLHSKIREIAHSILPINYTPYGLRRVMHSVSPNHIPHDCRKTFVSRCVECGVEPTAARRIVGHVGKDIHETTYTRLSKDYLLSEIEKVWY